jgi:hypothetical protein
MPDFAALPIGLTDVETDTWFARSWGHAGTLDPK